MAQGFSTESLNKCLIEITFPLGIHREIISDRTFSTESVIEYSFDKTSYLGIPGEIVTDSRSNSK